MNFDSKNKIATCLALEPQDLVYTDTSSSWIDTTNFESLTVLAIIGELTGVDGSNYLTPILQESDTTADADATSVATNDMIGAFTKVDAAAEDSVIQKVGYKGTKRYVRVKFDYTGTGISAGIVGAVGIASNARLSPPSDITPVAAT